MSYVYDYLAGAPEEHLVVSAGRREVSFSFQGRSFSLERTKGAQYLVELLLHPYQGISSAALYALVNHQPPRCGRPEQAGLGPDCARPCFHNLLPAPLADPQALREVRQRLNLLTLQLAEAEQGNDLGRGEELKLERDALVDYLLQSSSARLSGPDQADLDHKCSDSVYQAMQRVLRAIRRQDPALAQLLDSCLRLWGELLFIPAPHFSVLVMEHP